jgi:hypothetical protein
MTYTYLVLILFSSLYPLLHVTLTLKLLFYQENKFTSLYPMLIVILKKHHVIQKTTLFSCQYNLFHSVNSCYAGLNIDNTATRDLKNCILIIRLHPVNVNKRFKQ